MKVAILLLVLCSIALTLAEPRGYASGHGGKKIKFRYQYAAPFICGGAEDNDQLINGDYATTVTIHNPEEKATANIRAKVALTFPAGNKGAGAVSQFVNSQLKADEATQIDCDDIRENFFGGKNNRNPFGKEDLAMGYVVIESDVSIDVDRVNTAGNVEEDQIIEFPEEKKEAPRKKREPSHGHGQMAHGGKKKQPVKKVQVKKPPPKKVQIKKQPKVVKTKQHKEKQAPAPRTRMVSQQQVASIDAAPVRERAFKK